jgi:hypothetical protein
LRFWMSVLGLVIGLQSACIAANSDGFRTPDPAVEGDKFRSVLIKDVAVAPRESGDNGSIIEVSEVAAEKANEVSADKTSEVSAEKTSEVPAEKTSEAAAERERDHSSRSLQEMLILFLKGAGALTVLVLIYKGLKRWFGPKRQSESEAPE